MEILRARSRWGGSRGVQRTGLVGRVFEDHVALLVLVLAQGDEDDVAVVDPDLFPQLATDQTQTLDAVEALHTAVSSLLSLCSRFVARERVPWHRVCRCPTS